MAKSNHSVFTRAIFALIIWFIAAGAAAPLGLAQSAFATLSGTVVDEGGAVAPGAEVKILTPLNFGNPDGNTGSQAAPNQRFGLSFQMLGRSLGAGGGDGGFNPLYQVGGPRSFQFALKLLF